MGSDSTTSCIAVSIVVVLDGVVVLVLVAGVVSSIGVVTTAFAISLNLFIGNVWFSGQSAKEYCS